MFEVLKAINEALEKRQAIAVATIVRVEKSAPREVGAKMVRLLRDVAGPDVHESETALDGIPAEDWDLVVPDCDGVNGQGEFIRPHLQRWIEEAGL